MALVSRRRRMDRPPPTLRQEIAVMIHRSPALAALAAALLLLGCATNPATGKRQLSLISESQEISLGRDADQQFVEQLGLYGDEELARYVSELGQRLAARSERPHLPWTFRVVDDPVINAFALPGGFIYVTRGILAHLQSEAELAGVLGHEIGHVTARHSVNQLSKAQLAQIGLVAGMVAAPELGQQLGSLAQTGLGLLFLKFGRDDESQADELGVRYMIRTGYPPIEMAGVFDMLDRTAAAGGSERLPNWLSTHPAPADRRQRILSRAAELPPDVNAAPRHEKEFLDHLEGLVFGPNPREGFFRESTFHHPDLAFRLDYPSGWTYRNLKQAVVAQSPEQDAVVVLELAAGEDPRAAADDFFRRYQEQGLESGGPWIRNASGLPTVSDEIRVVGQDGRTRLRGGVAFTAHGGRVFRLLGYAQPDRWPTYARTIARAAASFAPERDRRILSVEPQRLQLVRLDRPMSLEEFQRRYPSDVPLERLAILNRVEPDATLEAGRVVKRVAGDDPSR
ncbi:MAG: peptidase M48 [Acidobacteria bacterium]|nr:MAG: peptidase M48 [Acidobacteriota bacterium]